MGFRTKENASHSVYGLCASEVSGDPDLNYEVMCPLLSPSNRYQVLAFAMDADKKQETEQQKLGSGKRLVVRPLIYKDFNNAIYNRIC